MFIVDWKEHCHAAVGDMAIPDSLLEYGNMPVWVCIWGQQERKMSGTSECISICTSEDIALCSWHNWAERQRSVQCYWNQSFPRGSKTNIILYIMVLITAWWYTKPCFSEAYRSQQHLMFTSNGPHHAWVSSFGSRQGCPIVYEMEE